MKNIFYDLGALDEMYSDYNSVELLPLTIDYFKFQLRQGKMIVFELRTDDGEKMIQCIIATNEELDEFLVRYPELELEAV